MSTYKTTNIQELEALSTPMPTMKSTGTATPAPSATATVPKAYTPAVNINPSGITQSYYTSPTNASNYEAGKPVYQQSQAVMDAANQLALQNSLKPGEYQSAYGDQIQGLIDSMLNRPDFQYDFATDPLYQQYAEKYQQLGKMAMKDTLGEAAALTGGYGNSYAQTAGQQTYQTYLQGLYDMVPQMRDQAYQAYRDKGDTLRQNLGMLQTQDASEYGRYRDGVGDWRDQRDYDYNLYNDMSDDEYNRYLNDAASWTADRAYWFEKEQAALAQANWEREFALAQAKKSKSSSSKKTAASGVPTGNSDSNGNGIWMTTKRS